MSRKYLRMVLSVTQSPGKCAFTGLVWSQVLARSVKDNHCKGMSLKCLDQCAECDTVTGEYVCLPGWYCSKCQQSKSMSGTVRVCIINILARMMRNAT